MVQMSPEKDRLSVVSPVLFPSPVSSHKDSDTNTPRKWKECGEMMHTDFAADKHPSSSLQKYR